MDSVTKKVVSQIDDQITAFMNKYVLSGMAIGMVKDGKLVFAKGYGLANARTQAKITPESVFRIASISKTFTAIGVMQLWEQGKFKLDDPINQHLKSYKVLHPSPFAPAVTIRHMLTHTSGIGEMRNTSDLLRGLVEPSFGSYKSAEAIPPLAAYYQGVLAPDVFPDQKWAYANHAYNTLQQLVEDISGQPFAQYMLEHVFEPLGMLKTDFLLSERVRGNLVQGYGFEKGQLKERDYIFLEGMGAGSVHSSVNEMALYLAALMNGGTNEHGSVLKPETLQKMMTPHYQEHPHLAGMGLGFFLENLDGHKAAWHGGALPGFNSSMWVSPEDKTGVIVWANTETRAIYNFGESVLRQLVDLPTYENRLPIKGIPQPSHLYGQMTGCYGPRKGFNSNTRTWLTLGGEVEISLDNGKLMLKSLDGNYKKGIQLHPVDANNPYLFEGVMDGKLTRLAFLCGPEGVIDRLSFSSLTFFTLYKRQPNQSIKFYLKVGKAALIAIAACILGGCIFKNKSGKRKNKCC